MAYLETKDNKWPAINLINKNRSEQKFGENFEKEHKPFKVLASGMVKTALLMDISS